MFAPDNIPRMILSGKELKIQLKKKAKNFREDMGMIKNNRIAKGIT